MHNLTFAKGATKIISLTIKNNGTVVDLTGLSVVLTIKTKYGDTDGEAQLIKTVTSHVSAEDGQTRFEISSAETEAMDIGEHLFEFTLVDGSDESILFKGRAFVTDKLKD